MLKHAREGNRHPALVKVYELGWLYQFWVNVTDFHKVFQKVAKTLK